MVETTRCPVSEAWSAIPRRLGELLEVHERKCVIGHGLFDGEGHCTAVLKAIMVSLNEETHRSVPFDPAVRAALEKFAASKDGLPT